MFPTGTAMRFVRILCEIQTQSSAKRWFRSKRRPHWVNTSKINLVWEGDYNWESNRPSVAFRPELWLDHSNSWMYFDPHHRILLYCWKVKPCPSPPSSSSHCSPCQLWKAILQHNVGTTMFLYRDGVFRNSVVLAFCQALFFFLLFFILVLGKRFCFALLWPEPFLPIVCHLPFLGI